MKKTILMTVGHGLVARNLLRNQFLEIIKKKNIKLVIVTTAAGNEKFEKEFLSQNIIIEKMRSNVKRPLRERLINFLHVSMQYNGTTEIKFKLREGKDKFIKFRSYIRRVFAFIFGKSVLIRKMIAKLDQFLLPDNVNDDLILKYKPSLCFCTSMLITKEIDLIKAAKKRNIPVIGMVKSWDNLVKDIPLRLQPDILLVWNEVMKSQAINHQLIPEEKIKMVGIPQFDIYEKINNTRSLTRNQFMKSIKANPLKKLILFASEGMWSPGDPEIVRIIIDFIKKGYLKKDCHLHVRPHFLWGDYLEPLFKLEEDGLVSVDTEWNKSDAFPDRWDPTYKDMLHLAHSMKFADVVITSPSTIVLDASYFNKPIINIGFDNSPTKNNTKNLKLLYEQEYYKKVMEYNATHFVTDKKQLLLKINESLININKENPNQNEFKRDFITYTDGRSGERIAHNILNVLNSPN